MKQARLLLLSFLLLAGGSAFAQYPDQSDWDWGDNYQYGSDRVQLALILDVSGSMDGLIEQAKSQLWNIVNGIMWSYEGNYPPRIEIALYEYGSDRAGSRNRYLRQRVPFTSDLDWISSELFRMRTDGRYEYAGAVLQSALYDLNWSRNPNDLKMIYIAGNERFNQGPVRASNVLQNAYREGIAVHTIFCGDEYEGYEQGWEDAARLGGGSYFAIEQDRRRRYNSDPYDQQLIGLNRRFNNTYIPYGNRANICYQRQQEEDRHASSYGNGIISQRIITKGSPAYFHPEWDLVDAVASGQVRLEEVDQNDLPPQMRALSIQDQYTFVRQKAKERAEVRDEIQQIASRKRANTPSLSAGSAQGSQKPGRAETPRQAQTLDRAIINATQQQVQVQKGNPPGRPTPRAPIQTDAPVVRKPETTRPVRTQPQRSQPTTRVNRQETRPSQVSSPSRAKPKTSPTRTTTRPESRPNHVQRSTPSTQQRSQTQRVVREKSPSQVRQQRSKPASKPKATSRPSGSVQKKSAGSSSAVKKSSSSGSRTGRPSSVRRKN